MRMLCGAIRVVAMETLGISLLLLSIFAAAGFAGESLGLPATRPLVRLRHFFTSFAPDSSSQLEPAAAGQGVRLTRLP